MTICVVPPKFLTYRSWVPAAVRSGTLAEFEIDRPAV